MQGPKVRPRPKVIQNRPLALLLTQDDLPGRPHLIFNRIAVIINLLKYGPDFLFMIGRRATQPEGLTTLPEGWVFKPTVQSFQAIPERREILIDQFEGLDMKAGAVEVFLDAEVEVLERVEG